MATRKTTPRYTHHAVSLGPSNSPCAGDSGIGSGSDHAALEGTCGLGKLPVRPGGVDTGDIRSLVRLTTGGVPLPLFGMTGTLAGVEAGGSDFATGGGAGVPGSNRSPGSVSRRPSSSPTDPS